MGKAQRRDGSGRGELKVPAESAIRHTQGCVEALGEPIVDLIDHRRLATIRAARYR